MFDKFGADIDIVEIIVGTLKLTERKMISVLARKLLLMN